MPAIRLDDSGEPALLGAFRKQVRGVARDHGPEQAWVVLLAWEGQQGVSRDDLIDIVKEELGLIPASSENVRPRPGSVQQSPFA